MTDQLAELCSHLGAIKLRDAQDALHIRDAIRWMRVCQEQLEQAQRDRDSLARVVEELQIQVAIERAR